MTTQKCLIWVLAIRGATVHYNTTQKGLENVENLALVLIRNSLHNILVGLEPL